MMKAASMIAAANELYDRAGRAPVDQTAAQRCVLPVCAFKWLQTLAMLGSFGDTDPSSHLGERLN
jgi:hypothetical protein